MSYDDFAQELAAVRSRGDQFNLRAREAVEGAALLPEALEELSVALEELRVTEEEVRAQHEQLAEVRQSLEGERDHYRQLFQLAPAAYLVTDRVGVIREANRRAASLLGVAQHFLVGRPLAMYVAAEDRQGLRDRLNRLGGLDTSGWQPRLQPRQQEPIPVLISTSIAHDQAGEVTGLHWLLQELAPASHRSAGGNGERGQASPTLLAELVTSRSTGPPTLAAVPSAARTGTTWPSICSGWCEPRRRCCGPMGPG